MGEVRFGSKFEETDVLSLHRFFLHMRWLFETYDLRYRFLDTAFFFRGQELIETSAALKDCFHQEDFRALLVS